MPRSRPLKCGGQGMHETGMHETSMHETSMHETGMHETSMHETGMHETPSLHVQNSFPPRAGSLTYGIERKETTISANKQKERQHGNS
eukprot:1161715-Pelagomonas_calceolata.AAC.6